MRMALHPAICGWDMDLMADYCRYMGVTDLFYQLHDVAGYRDGGFQDTMAIQRLSDDYRTAGLKLSAVNDFLPDTAEALERRRDGLAATIEPLAQAGVETLILFVLQPESDELWAPIAGLYETLVPRAQSAGIKIATHGHWCAGHLAYNRSTLQRIIDCSPEPANGICLCAGCFHQAGEDPAAIVREMPGRIHCVHIRDTSFVGGCDLEELPLGSGTVPIVETLRALAEINYGGLIMPEHLSSPKAQANMETTHAHAAGYIHGILASI
jgi:D-mannonate dehydratase